MTSQVSFQALATSVGDRLCPWTLLRFHYKLWWLPRQPLVVTASSNAGGSQAAWRSGKEVAARNPTSSFPFLGTTCFFHSTHPFTAYSTSHKPKPKFVPPATPPERQCPCPAPHCSGHPATLLHPCAYVSCHRPSLLGAADFLRYWCYVRYSCRQPYCTSQYYRLRKK